MLGSELAGRECHFGHMLRDLLAVVDPPSDAEAQEQTIHGIPHYTTLHCTIVVYYICLRNDILFYNIT